MGEGRWTPTGALRFLKVDGGVRLQQRVEKVGHEGRWEDVPVVSEKNVPEQVVTGGPLPGIELVCGECKGRGYIASTEIPDIESKCGECGGLGVVDSGGFREDGQPIDVVCTKCSKSTPQVPVESQGMGSEKSTQGKFSHIMHDDLTGIVFMYFKKMTVQEVGDGPHHPSADMLGAYQMDETCLHIPENEMPRILEAILNLIDPCS